MRLKAKDFVIWFLARWTCWIVLRNVTLIRAVSSCWKSSIGSAEAALSPDDILCLPALGLVGGAEIRKKNISLISDNSLKKTKTTTTSEVFCCCWALPFNLFGFFFSCEGTKLFFNNRRGSYSCCCRAAVKVVTDSFHVSEIWFGCNKTLLLQRHIWIQVFSYHQHYGTAGKDIDLKSKRLNRKGKKRHFLWDIFS